MRTPSGRRPQTLGPEAGYEASADACRRRPKGVAEKEHNRNIHSEPAMNAQAHLPDTLEELRALEREVEREWGGCTGPSTPWPRCGQDARPGAL
jgi:hypothetical protein